MERLASASTASVTSRAFRWPTPALQAAVENSPAVFVATNSNQITFNDTYGDNGVEQLELTAPDGTLSLGSTAGITFTAGASGTSTMTIQGTVANLSTALGGLTFTPTTGFTGMASLTISADNLGNSGSGGHLTASSTVSIDVLAQSPIQTSGSTITVNSTGLGDNASFSRILRPRSSKLLWTDCRRLSTRPT